MRAWRRDRLEEILRPAGDTLRLPVGRAVAFAFVMTNHVSWRVLREELGLTQGQAVETTTAGIEAGLFRVSEHRPHGKAAARGVRYCGRTVFMSSGARAAVIARSPFRGAGAWAAREARSMQRPPAW